MLDMLTSLTGGGGLTGGASGASGSADSTFGGTHGGAINVGGLGISNKTLMVIAGVVVLGVVILKRK